MNSHELPADGLGVYLTDVEATMVNVEECDTVERIWHKDYTVWRDSPAEITNRLGWLTVTDLMREQMDALEFFIHEIQDDNFKHVVLLGMGGSSLGSEVLKQTFGSAIGYPELIVLDSTIPAQIETVSDIIDPAQTLFIVSSKSGGTIEVVSLESYFRDLVEQAVGKDRANRNFITITDPGTELANRAEEGEFRHAFINSPAIGGRFSVLSFFGLVPAMLMGLDIPTLLDRADRMRGECASSVYGHENSGAWLGIVMGTLAKRGRDKLTLITSPEISSFGLWVEQLLAESTGKDGCGIIPITGEPLVDIACYGNDRLFVCLRLDDDNNFAIDEFVGRLRDAEQPVLVITLRDKYDLGAEFFRWEFATAVAGAIMGIHPFNQPNVQQAKEATGQVLQEFLSHGNKPTIDTDGSLKTLLGGIDDNSYLAILAYTDQNPLTDKLIENFRKAILEHYYLPTTFGYGPRYLHSTGQLHKGGPNTGLFLQITTTHATDVPIPGKPYSFNILADAQALGDLQALRSSGRRVISIQMKEADTMAIMAISKLISEVAEEPELPPIPDLDPS